MQEVIAQKELRNNKVNFDICDEKFRNEFYTEPAAKKLTIKS